MNIMWPSPWQTNLRVIFLLLWRIKGTLLQGNYPQKKKCSIYLHVKYSYLKLNMYTHYRDDINGAMASPTTSLTIVYPTVYSSADQRKYQSSALLAFVWGIHRWPVNSPHKGPVTWKMFPFDDVIMPYERVMGLFSTQVIFTYFL